MADGADNSRILSSVASIASRSRDAQNAVAKVKPNTTPPGNTTGTVTLLDTPVTLVSVAAAGSFTWQSLNVYEYIPGVPKAVLLYVMLRHNAGATSSSRLEFRRDILASSVVYTAARTTSEAGNDATDTCRMFMPISQSGTFDLQLISTGSNTHNYDIVIEGYLS